MTILNILFTATYLEISSEICLSSHVWQHAGYLRSGHRVQQGIRDLNGLHWLGKHISVALFTEAYMQTIVNCGTCIFPFIHCTWMLHKHTCWPCVFPHDDDSKQPIPLFCLISPGVLMHYALFIPLIDSNPNPNPYSSVLHRKDPLIKTSPEQHNRMGISVKVTGCGF